MKRRLARGSIAPGAWIASSVRARFPRLGAALGPQFDAMLVTYFSREPDARTSVRESGARLAGFLADNPDYPAWYAELAALDRAHVEVLHAASAPEKLRRCDLTLERTLRLVPAHVLIDVASATDELWTALDSQPGLPATWNRVPRALDLPRTVLVWSHDGASVRERTARPIEGRALRAAQRVTTLSELSTLFEGDTAHALAVDTVLGWIDDGLLAA